MSADKIKVLHFGLGSNPGGVETYLHKISSFIDKDRFSFSFIDSTSSVPCFYKELSEFGCEFYKITPRRSHFFKNKSELKRLFEENNFDVLHFHVNTLSYIEPVIVALKYGVKVIIHSRNAGARGSFLTNTLHYYNQKRIELLKDKVACVAVSELAGKWLFGQKVKYSVLNNGVNTQEFSFDKKSRDEVRKALGIDVNTVALASIAAFTPAKNQQFILKMLRKMDESDYMFKVFFVGDGHLRSSIEKMANDYSLQDYVEFVGKKSNIPELMSAFDILLLPSFYEGFPNVVLEAQSCGLPCIISDNITDEVVVNDSLVWKLPIQDVSFQEWIKKINDVSKMVCNQDYKVRENACSEIEEMGYSTKHEINKLEMLYVSVVS